MAVSLSAVTTAEIFAMATMTLRLFFLFIYFFSTHCNHCQAEKSTIDAKKKQLLAQSSRVELRSFNAANSTLQSRLLLLSIVGERKKYKKKFHWNFGKLPYLSRVVCYCQCTFHLPSLAPLPKSCPIDSSIAICYNSKEI